MKAKDIERGKHYRAKVSGKLTTVRVDEIVSDWRDPNKKRFNVTNLATGRRTIFRSAAKFRCPVTANGDSLDPSTIYDYVISEAGVDYPEKYESVAAAKQHLQDTVGEGQPMEWVKQIIGAGSTQKRVLISGPFQIRAVKKEATGV